MNALVCIFLIFGVIVCLPYAPLGLQMSSNHYVGFADGVRCSTWNLSFATWELFAPDGELVDLQGIFLGQTTNNISE